jgi:predicted ATPase
MDYSAMQLFVQVAQRVRHDFIGEKSVIAQICWSVDGMPLAIELAASWVRGLSCSEIAQEIQRDLRFLHTKLRDVPEHHRSLDGVFASAWAFLTLEESRTLCQLSVFRGGFGSAAASAVTLPASTIGGID